MHTASSMLIAYIANFWTVTSSGAGDALLFAEAYRYISSNANLLPCTVSIPNFQSLFVGDLHTLLTTRTLPLGRKLSQRRSLKNRWAVMQLLSSLSAPASAQKARPHAHDAQRAPPSALAPSRPLRPRNHSPTRAARPTPIGGGSPHLSAPAANLAAAAAAAAAGPGARAPAAAAPPVHRPPPARRHPTGPPPPSPPNGISSPPNGLRVRVDPGRRCV
jgi:hypothetical protein